MKKGQAETMGILILIIIILIAGTFALGIYITNQPSPDSRRVQHIANNYVNTLAGISLCEDVTVSDAIETCAVSLTLDVCGKNACDLVRENAQALQSTLDPKFGYELKDLDGETIISSVECSEKISAQEYPITSDVIVKYALCL
jgi:hypothetical protein